MPNDRECDDWVTDDMRKCQFCGKSFPREPMMHWPHVWYCDDECRDRAMERGYACEGAELEAVSLLGAPPNSDRLLQDFFDRAGRLIFASPDPLAAMRVFLEGVPRRGDQAMEEDNA
jgi:hypothetical protein